MNALSIDCAVSRIAVAAKKEQNLVKTVLDVGVKQSEKLLPTVDEVLKTIGVEASNLDYIAVTIGPGSFTGLRLGLSVAKAFTAAFGTPVYGISSLEAYAEPYLKQTLQVVSVIEAKEEEFFFSVYKNKKEEHAPADLPFKEIIPLLQKESTSLVVGPGAKAFVSCAKENNMENAVTSFSLQHDATESLFTLAEQYRERGIPPLKDYDGPLYIRKSEAEIVYEKKQANL